ncbi:MAG: hypothetical protein RSE58_03275 [Clostridia bacterium]
MKKVVSLLFAMFFVFELSAARAGEAFNIAEVKSNTEERWQQTYHAKGRDIAVDIEIEVPDAVRCPIFTTSFPENSEVDSSVPEYYQPLEHTREFGFRNDQYLFGIGINSLFWPVEGEGNQAYPQKYLNSADVDWNAAYAENNPFTVGEAWNFFAQEMERCYGAEASKELFLESLVLRGAMRRFNDKTSEYGEITGVMGGYTFNCFQSFYSIPVLAGVPSTFLSNATSAESKAIAPFFTATISNENSFDFMFMRSAIKEEKIADVPLCSFDKARAAFEDLIESGNIRQVYTVRLGYSLFIDHQKKDVLWAVPCWVAECEYYKSAKEERNPKFDKIELFEKDPNTRKLIVNAQTGELINPNDKSKNRSKCPTIIK